MSQFNTIHLFGFGDAQIIGTDVNRTVKSDTLTALAAFVDHIKALKPEEVILTDYHVIHIFNEMDVRYLGKGTEDRKDKTDFIIKIAEVDAALLGALVDELATIEVAPVAE
jgi:cell division FtsZ-interacting protein ZapD